MKRSALACTLLALTFAAGTALAADTQPATQPAASPEEAKIIKRADGIGHVEVVSVTRQDNRPSDGNLIEVIELKYLDHAGSYDGNIQVTVDLGGRRANAQPFVPSGPVLPGSMEKGKTYWVVFAMVAANAVPMKVLAMWPQEKAPVKELKEHMAAMTKGPE